MYMRLQAARNTSRNGKWCRVDERLRAIGTTLGARWCVRPTKANVMGWSVCWCSEWKRWVGYGVPAYCDFPGCDEKIDRGLGYACTENHYGMNDASCGRYYCSAHECPEWNEETEEKLCGHDDDGKISSEHPEWVEHVLSDETWKQWREENPEWVRAQTGRPPE